MLRAKGYLRYVDDFALFHDDAERLQEWRLRIGRYREGRRLCLHACKTGITIDGRRPSCPALAGEGRRLPCRTAHARSLRRSAVCAATAAQAGDTVVYPVYFRGCMMFAYRMTGILCVLLAAAAPSFGQTPRVHSSMLLLVDTSGSMGDPIGSGNAEIKLEAAKEAAIAAVDRALAGRTEVAILAFEGECDNPVSERLGFTTDRDRLTRFIDGLRPGGGTPMAEAVLVANRFMQANRNPRANSQMIVLLADGENACGDVAQAMAQLQAAGIVFRHETVGFGIEPASDAARDLRHVATTSGGQYHHAASATQLADVFMEFVDTLTVIDLLGMFGSGAQTPPTDAGATTSPSGDDAAQPDTGVVTGMLGMFTAAEDAAGALAIDANRGSWGWAAGYAKVAEARQGALEECGESCRIVMTFERGCAAYAAGRTQSSSRVHAWGSEFDTKLQATEAAVGECEDKGGKDCRVYVSSCAEESGERREGGGQTSTTTNGGVAADTGRSGEGSTEAQAPRRGEAEVERQGTMSGDEPARANRIAECERGSGSARLRILGWTVESDQDGNKIPHYTVENVGSDSAYLEIADGSSAAHKYQHLSSGGTAGSGVGAFLADEGKIVIGYVHTNNSGFFAYDTLCSQEAGLADTMSSIDWDQLAEDQINIWYIAPDGRVTVNAGTYAVTCSHRPGYGCGR